MNKPHLGFLWTIKHVDKNGNLIFEEQDIPNILVDAGEKAIIDTFCRNRDSIYFVDGDYFYVGLYNGTISESTILSTVPNEPSGNGYSRQSVERSLTGWPTIEKDVNNNWQVVSKELTITASGGDIGPVNGAFLATSSDNGGTLVGVVARSVSTTILSGGSAIFSLKFRLK